MGEGMPYHFHKGHTWQTIDRYLSTHDLDKRVERKKKVLDALRDPDVYPRFTDIFAVIAPSSYSPPTANLPTPPKSDPVAALVAHMNKDWFGLRKHGDSWAEQPAFAADHDTTGFWSNWYGDAEAIVRETTERAIEVSLGITHGDEVPSRNDQVSDDSVEIG